MQKINEGVNQHMLDQRLVLAEIGHYLFEQQKHRSFLCLVFHYQLNAMKIVITTNNGQFYSIWPKIVWTSSQVVILKITGHQFRS